MSSDLSRLCNKLQYQFRDLKLLNAALTHRSYGNANNERLEFLGDSILNFVIAEVLFNKFADAKEGELSRLRSSLVKGDTLAIIARDLCLGDYMHLGAGELRSGGFRRDSILADAVEAVIAAIYLDSNIDQARQFILAIYESRINAINLAVELKDPKTQLQELLQSSKYSLPQYKLIKIEGELHQQIFVIKCTVTGFAFEAVGKGSSRREAVQIAATEFLKQLPF